MTAADQLDRALEVAAPNQGEQDLHRTLQSFAVDHGDAEARAPQGLDQLIAALLPQDHADQPHAQSQASLELKADQVAGRESAGVGHDAQRIGQILERLTDDEELIIVYTSVDPDWFTNMIIESGELLKWFNINFEGESREEIDFRTAKCENWMATVTMAKTVVDAASSLEGKGLNDILTKYWWEHQQFAFFGVPLAEKLNADANLKSQLRDLFSCQKDKLSYYDLF